jgi:asparaginyl-tRNA synthetase
MKAISIDEAIKKKKGQVTIHGWVHRERGSSKFKFIVLRDPENIIQCVIKKEDVGDKQFEIADKLQVETSIELTGTIKEDKRAPTGYEIQVSSFKVIGESDKFPISKDQSVEFLADNRHLWLRSRKMNAILKIRSTVFGAIHEYFRKHQFYEYHSPSFTASAGEEGSSQFQVNYFGKPMFLTQTWQLYAEAGIFSLGNIYTIAPSFRAEKSKTSRHLTEYWHAEMEMAWCNFDDIIKHGEDLIKHVVKEVLKKNSEQLKILERNTKVLETTAKKAFTRVTYDEALNILEKKCKMKVPWGKDLRTVEEDKLSELYDTPLIVTNYPKKVKAFYMKEDDNNPKVVLGTDFIAPEGYGEIIGGSQREEDPDKLLKEIKAKGEDPKNYGWYLDLRKYGSIPHGGFGFGVERVIAWICGLDNIKDAIAFPRTMLRTTP